MPMDSISPSVTVSLYELFYTSTATPSYTPARITRNIETCWHWQWVPCSRELYRSCSSVTRVVPTPESVPVE